MKSRPLYYASDKAMFDALSQHKMTKDAFEQLLLSRGIITARKTDSEDLATYFSRLTHDYFDHQQLAKTLSSGHRREKSSISRLTGEVSIDILESASEEVKNRSKELGSTIETITHKNSVEIKIKYQELDYNKSEFRQLVTKESLISLEPDSSGVSIRHTSNDFTVGLTETLIDLIRGEFDEEEQPMLDNISLELYKDHATRTQFFSKFTAWIGDYELIDVSDVWVTNSNSEDEEEIDTGVHIDKASLKGEGVLSSSELTSLFKKGFFISRMVWLVRKKDIDSDIYVLEALFKNPDECKSFAYLVRGIHRYSKTEKTNNVTRLLATRAEEITMHRLIEESARSAFEEIRQGIGKS